MPSPSPSSRRHLHRRHTVTLTTTAIVSVSETSIRENHGSRAAVLDNLDGIMERVSIQWHSCLSEESCVDAVADEENQMQVVLEKNFGLRW